LRRFLATEILGNVRLVLSPGIDSICSGDSQLDSELGYN